MSEANIIKKRFDGYLPVVVDIETTGVDYNKHGILEIAAVLVDYDDTGMLTPTEKDLWHVEPFDGAIIDPEATKVHQIDHTHPFRLAKSEALALKEFFAFLEAAVKTQHCRRAVLVGHNAHFDLNFILAAARRCKIKDNPLHSFTCLDTATLGGLLFGKTVLAKALKSAGIIFDKNEAHSAMYDAEKTAALFCQIVNSVTTQ